MVWVLLVAAALIVSGQCLAYCSAKLCADRPAQQPCHNQEGKKAPEDNDHKAGCRDQVQSLGGKFVQDAVATPASTVASIPPVVTLSGLVLPPDFVSRFSPGQRSTVLRV